MTVESGELQSFEHRGYRLTYLDSAPADTTRPVALLLHGFPDESSMWLPQIQALHARGYRVIAPNTLGCGGSEIGRKLDDYLVTQIAADHAALLNHLGVNTAHVAGHDWGAAIAWVFAGQYPQLTQSLVVLSVGHPTVYGRSGLRQKLKGWYTFYFLMGRLSERLLLGSGALSLAKVFGSHPNMDEVIPRISQAGRLRAAVRLYRANAIAVLFKSFPKVAAPTLGIWSENDAFLVESQMQQSAQRVTGDWEYERWQGKHWIPIEQAEKLSQRLAGHFEKYA